MATQIAPEAPFTYRTGSNVSEAYEQWLRDNPQAVPQYTKPWDVLRVARKPTIAWALPWAGRRR